MHVVSDEDLERGIEKVRAAVSDPRAGIYGPGSISWKMGRETAVALGGGRAALLQLAHPWVAAAVMEHSDTRSDPVGRLQRTFAGVFQMTYGDLDHAIRMARRLHQIHTHITGTLRAPGGRWRDGEPYRANDASPEG